MNDKGLPHNPMINSGAIMTCALIQKKLPLYQRFAYMKKFWSELSGGQPIGFQNATYLGERATASRNRALAHMMKDSGAFPEGTDMDDTLNLYFQICSLELTAEKLSQVAGSLANGGTNPMTGKKIFQEETVNNALNLMRTCGLYDYSGEWSYTVGIPAKSGVGGAIFLVIPKVMGIAIFSPRLDERGNSVRGIALSKKMLTEYSMHIYDSLKGVVTPFC